MTFAVGDYLDNRYVIDRPIARGGMSTVYRCVDLRLDREVAAKIMDERYVHDATFRERFRREALAMAQLSHPNLVNVYDFSARGNQVFLIMELITGGTLRELVAERGPMPPHAALAVMRATLTGLALAHKKDLVHRDIKPDNILINGDHRVKLADFGLVRAAADSTHSTDQIVGTVSYLSPEQVDGSSMTQASDVYSAGIVLFELLTGTVPFSGDTPLAHAYARLSHDAPAPSSRIQGIPRLVDELVATATARNPDERFVDATEFLAALDDVATELHLPDYTVPLPSNSAANRAAAHPTTVTASSSATLIPESPVPPEVAAVPPTRVVPAAPTAFREPMPPVSTMSPLSPASPDSHNVPEQRDAQDSPGSAGSPGLPAAQPAPRTQLAPPQPVSNRNSAVFTAFVVVSVLVALGVAIGAWWFGSGLYSELPALIRLPQEPAVEQEWTGL